LKLSNEVQQVTVIQKTVISVRSVLWQVWWWVLYVPSHRELRGGKRREENKSMNERDPFSFEFPSAFYENFPSTCLLMTSSVVAQEQSNVVRRKSIL
jgi:hypothetical protein